MAAKDEIVRGYFNRLLKALKAGNETEEWIKIRVEIDDLTYTHNKVKLNEDDKKKLIEDIINLLKQHIEKTSSFSGDDYVEKSEKSEKSLSLLEARESGKVRGLIGMIRSGNTK